MFRSAKAAVFAAAALISLAAPTGLSSAATYAFDNKHADVRFTYYVGFISQSGRFSELDGIFQFDRRSPEHSSMSAVIKTASLTANAWEAELKSSSFFNVVTFPEIRFISRSVSSADENSAEFSGDLTMNGVTQPVTLKVVFQPSAEAASGGAHASAESRPLVIATAHLKRSSFNMTALSFLVDDEIDIQIKAALQEKK